jgi:hypothetical protein
MKAITILIPLGVVVALTAANVADRPSHQRKVLSQEFVTEGASLGDVDGDGVADLVAGPHWYAGPEFEKKNRYRPGEPVDPKGYAHDSFLSWVMDVNGDGKNDVLQIAHQPAFHLDIYVQPEEASEDWPKHRVVTSFGGESPEMVDLTGDKKPELVGLAGGVWGFYTADWSEPTKPWTFHAVSEDTKSGHYTHGLGIGDLNGDKRPDILWKDGWFEGPENPTAGLWTFHKFQFSPQGGAQMLVYDIDGDDDNDIVTSLWAHGWGLAWFENELVDGEVSLKKHILMPEDAKPGVGGAVFSQTHALATGDFNGDGLTDFVTGKRWWAHGGSDPGADQPAVLYWFELKRGEKGAEFIPHLVDSDSGVGCQIAVQDLDADGCTDIAIGNKKGVFVFRTK